MRTLLFLLALSISQTVPGQTYPGKPIRMIVPFTPGGSADTMARIVGQELLKTLGQPVVIDNRPGAAGNVGTETAIRAAADGYTLLFVVGSIVTTNPWLYPRLAFDPMRELAPITKIGSGGFLLITHQKAPYRTLPALVEYATRNRGQLNYGSYGSGSFPHLAMEMLKREARIDLTHVPYRGAAPAVNDLYAGQIDVMFDSMLNALPQVRAGRLRALAVSTATRSAQLPDLPSIVETFPTFNADSWQGVFAPAGTPQSILDRLHDEIASILRRSSVEARLRDLSFEITPMSRERFAREVRADHAKWGKIVSEAHIVAE